MLTHIDRMQLAVRDVAAAEETFSAVLGAKKVREDRIDLLQAKRTVMHPRGRRTGPVSCSTPT